jgi:hypothetical protein
MGTKILQGRGRSPASTTGPLFGQQGDRTVQADIENFLDVAKIGVGAGVGHKGAVATEARLDGLAVLRVRPDLARQA